MFEISSFLKDFLVSEGSSIKNVKDGKKESWKIGIFDNYDVFGLLVTIFPLDVNYSDNFLLHLRRVNDLDDVETFLQNGLLSNGLYVLIYSGEDVDIFNSIENISIKKIFPENLLLYLAGHSIARPVPAAMQWIMRTSIRSLRCFTLHAANVLLSDPRMNDLTKPDVSADQSGTALLFAACDTHYPEALDFLPEELITICMTCPSQLYEISRAPVLRKALEHQFQAANLGVHAHYYQFLLNLIDSRSLQGLLDLMLLVRVVLQAHGPISFLDFLTNFGFFLGNNAAFQILSSSKEKEVIFNDMHVISKQFIDFIMDKDEHVLKNHVLEQFERAILFSEVEKRFDFFSNTLNNVTLSCASSNYDLAKKKKVCSINDDNLTFLTERNFLFSSLVCYADVIISCLFTIRPTDGLLSLSWCSVDNIARLRYVLYTFKKNIYHEVHFNEFTSLESFLDQLLELYCRLLEFNEFKIQSLETYDLQQWQDFHEKYLIPIDTLTWNIYEESRFFSFRENVSVSPVKISIEIASHVIEKMFEVGTYFISFLKKHYPLWVKQDSNAPISVVNVVERFFMEGSTASDFHMFILLDCCREEIWDDVKHLILNDFPELESFTTRGTSILPTSTHWARRAIVTGKYPKDHGTFESYNEAQELFDFLKGKFPSLETNKIPISGGRLATEEFYSPNCELLLNNSDLVEKIMRDDKANFQFIIFNATDVISHNFEMRVSKMVMERIYEEKIKPVIRETLRVKQSPVFFFMTDHGICKLYSDFDWYKTSFKNHFSADSGNFIIHKNRWFVTTESMDPLSMVEEVRGDSYKTQFTSGDILLLEGSDMEKWGLPKRHVSREGTRTLRGYYFGNMYLDLLKKFGKAATYYAHGGVSPFELFLKFTRMKLRGAGGTLEHQRPAISLSTSRQGVVIDLVNQALSTVMVYEFAIFSDMDKTHYKFFSITLKEAGTEGSRFSTTIKPTSILATKFSYSVRYDMNDRLHEVAGVEEIKNPDR